MKNNDDLQISEAQQISAMQQEISELHEKISQLESELEQSKNDHRRALADYLNLQRVSRDERQKIVATAAADLIGQLLEPLDYLQTAASHFSDKSLEMIYGQILRVLKQEGLSEIEAKGKVFDPHTMEAVEAVAGPKDEVVRVRQSGYVLGSALLRPAKVEVGSGE